MEMEMTQLARAAKAVNAMRTQGFAGARTDGSHGRDGSARRPDQRMNLSRRTMRLTPCCVFYIAPQGIAIIFALRPALFVPPV
ncbi:hypothetical protein AAV32_03650 [Kerstersia gyiorum]|uniref:Uncharacterized protein n=1 Tax=Kerstersia gyiorum TaxID=206506 RepID=A0A171KWT8_9BURK|nr:hypothetical protein AAV32_03650 [Kerstersia gyiorum]